MADMVGRQTEAYLGTYAVSHPKLAVDLLAVSFLDSSGVGLMVRAKKQAAKAGAELRFTGLRENVRNVVRLAKLEDYLLKSE
jgi:anti-anti-sigma factor